MSTACDLPDLSLPRKSLPSERDRDIYLAVRIDKKPQNQVAHEFGISQPRVNQIVREVRAWIDETLAGTGFEETASTEESACDAEPAAAATVELDRRERLAIAECRVYERLEYVYGQALAAWRKSLQDAEVCKSRLGGAEERIVKTQSGKVALLNQAMRAALAIARLQGVDTSGREARKEAQAEGAARTMAGSAAQPPLTPATQAAATPEPPLGAASAQTPYKSEIPAENATFSELEELGLSEAERLALFEEAMHSAA